MATTVLRPDSTISSSNSVDHNSSSTDLHSPINDITPNDSTYTHTTHASADAQAILGLDNLPADAVTSNPIASGTSISYNFRTRHFLTRDDDSITLLAQITSSAGVAYTDQVTVDVYNSGGATSFADQTGNFTVNATGAAASESDWNNARLQFDWSYNKSAKGDPIDIDISNAALTVTYTQVAGPVISSPTASATGQNTGTGGFSTDTTSGTGYYYISTSATPPSATDLKAGASPADDSGNSTVTASPHTFNFSGLNPDTTYYAHYIQDDGSSDSNIISSGSFKTYKTPPVISSPTVTSIKFRNALGGFTTNTTEGSGYAYVSTSATPPSATDLKDGTGAVANWPIPVPIGTTSVSATFSSDLTPGINYYAHYIQAITDAPNPTVNSNIVTSAQFTSGVIGNQSASATGDTTGTGYFQTSVISGTAYYLVNTSSTPLTAATIKAGGGADSGSVTVTESTVDFDFTGLSAGTTYYAHYVQTDTSGDSNVVVTSSFTTTGGAATISSPTASSTGQTTGTGGFSTNTTSGTGYYYISESATPPNATDLKAGGSPAADSGSSTITASPHTFNFSGLTYNTLYYAHYIQNDGSDSNILTSAGFTTEDAVTGAETFSTTLSDALSGSQSILASIAYDNALAKALAKNNISLRSDTFSLSNTIDYNVGLSFDEALNIILQLTQAEARQTSSDLTIELQSVLDFIFSSIQTGSKSITLGTLLDKIIQAPKTKTISEEVPLTLNTQQVGSTSISGVSTFGVSLGYLSDNTRSTLAQMNVDMVLSSAEEVSKAIEALQTFSFTLSFDGDIFGTAILDDPYYGSPDNYIFVDLTNVLAGGTGVVSGEITFINSLGKTQTVGLVGNAAIELLTTLAQQDLTNRITSKSETFATTLDYEYSKNLAKLFTFTAGIDLTQLSDQSASLLKSIIYSITSAYDEAKVLQTDKLLTFSAQLNEELLKQLTTNFSISFDTSLQESIAVLADLDTALTYLISLTEDYVTGQVADITFSTDFLKTTQVQSILNPTFTLLNNLSYTEQSLAVFNSTIQFLSDLRLQIAGDIGLLEAITFAASLNQVEATVLTINEAFDLLINLSESTNIQLDKTETITLLMQLADSYAGVRSTSSSISFNSTLSDTSVSLTSKLASMVFASTLNQIEAKNISTDKTLSLLVEAAQDQQITLTKDETLALEIILNESYTNITDITKAITFNTELAKLPQAVAGQLAEIIFNANMNKNISVQTEMSTLATFGSILAAILEGAISGTIDADIAFALEIAKGETVLSTLLPGITFSNNLNISGIANKDFLQAITFQAQLGEAGIFNLSKEGLANFRVDVIDTLGTRLDYAPSLDFNLEAIEASATNKNILAQMLLDIEPSLLSDRTKSIPGLINYGITQDDLQTELRVIAEGVITMSTAMQESSVLQSLKQTGITFGHILGLSALSSADFVESISFGTVQNLEVEEFLLKFEVVTPDGRVLKVYFEDRITIVDEENRILKVYKDPTNTIN